jgi:hypothetical protein
MSAHDPAGQLDLEILSAEVALFLAQVPVAEGIGVKLSRLLFGFLQTEVLPQACRAAEQGIDPTPLFAVVTDVLCLYSDALQRPELAGD